MRIPLASGSLVETVVTLAVALLMTFAGFEMLQGSSVAGEPELAVPATPADLAVPQSPDGASLPPVAMPHVDQTMA